MNWFFLLLAHLLFYSCHSKISERHISSVETEIRYIADSCVADWQCEQDSLCRFNRCVSRDETGKFPGQRCRYNDECLSDICRNGICAPKGNFLLGNEQQNCRTDFDCQSGKCKNNICRATGRHPGFFGQTCENDFDCIGRSKCLSNKKCGYGFTDLNCAEIGKRVDVQWQCCSKNWDRLSKKCLPVRDCAQDVTEVALSGRYCMTEKQSLSSPAKSPSDCCSCSERNGICIPQKNKFCVPSLNECPSGFQCSTKTLRCKPFL